MQTTELDTFKRCPRCGEFKNITEFGKSKQTPSGKNCWCLVCCREVAKEYRERNKNEPTVIYNQMWSRQKYYRKHRPHCVKPFTISIEEFVDWYDSQPLECHYCGVPEEKIPSIDDPILQKTKKLTIDCKENSLGYVKDNLVLACSRCNFVKGDFFSYDEWMFIAEKFVTPKFLPSTVSNYHKRRNNG